MNFVFNRAATALLSLVLTFVTFDAVVVAMTADAGAPVVLATAER